MSNGGLVLGRQEEKVCALRRLEELGSTRPGRVACPAFCVSSVQAPLYMHCAAATAVRPNGRRANRKQWGVSVLSPARKTRQIKSSVRGVQSAAAYAASRKWSCRASRMWRRVPVSGKCSQSRPR